MENHYGSLPCHVISGTHYSPTTGGHDPDAWAASARQVALSFDMQVYLLPAESVSTDEGATEADLALDRLLAQISVRVASIRSALDKGWSRFTLHTDRYSQQKDRQ